MIKLASNCSNQNTQLIVIFKMINIIRVISALCEHEQRKELFGINSFGLNFECNILGLILIFRSIFLLIFRFLVVHFVFVGT